MTTRELKTHDSNQEKNDFMQSGPGKLSKVLHVLQPLAGVFPARDSPCTRPGPKARWQSVEPQESATTGRCPHPAPRSAFMNGPTSQTADWLSRRLRGPIIVSRRLVSAWGLSSSAAVNGREPSPHPQGKRKGRGVYIYFYF